jgi:hypothetical protein
MRFSSFKRRPYDTAFGVYARSGRSPTTAANKARVQKRDAGKTLRTILDQTASCNAIADMQVGSTYWPIALLRDNPPVSDQAVAHCNGLDVNRMRRLQYRMRINCACGIGKITTRYSKFYAAVKTMDGQHTPI